MAEPVAVGKARWRVEIRRTYFSGEDSLASNKPDAFLPSVPCAPAQCVVFWFPVSYSFSFTLFISGKASLCLDQISGSRSNRENAPVLVIFQNMYRTHPMNVIVLLTGKNCNSPQHRREQTGRPPDVSESTTASLPLGIRPCLESECYPGTNVELLQKIVLPNAPAPAPEWVTPEGFTT